MRRLHRRGVGHTAAASGFAIWVMGSGCLHPLRYSLLSSCTGHERAAEGASVAPPTHGETAAEQGTAQPAPASPFTSSVRFRLRDNQVTADNVPSATEIESLLPTLSQLRSQLPSAREMEQRYVRDSSPGSGRSVPPDHTGVSKPLWPDSDTAEEMIDEERFGRTNEEEMVQPTAQHVLLAWKALLWGTAYAVLGVAALALGTLYSCGYRSMSDVLDFVGTHDRRQRDKLIAEAQLRGDEVHFLQLDLTNPTALPEQVRDLWAVLKDIVEREGDDNSNR